MGKNGVLSATVVSAEGSPMMEVKAIRRKGDNLAVVGALMGAWDTDMYMSPQEVWKAIKIGVNASVIGYFLILPWILFRSRKKKIK